MRAPRVMTQHNSIRYSSSCPTCINMGASIFFTAAMIRVFRHGSLCVCVTVHVHVGVWACAHTCMCVRVHMCARMCVCGCGSERMGACTCVWAHVRACVCVCECMVHFMLHPLYYRGKRPWCSVDRRLVANRCLWFEGVNRGSSLFNDVMKGRMLVGYHHFGTAYQSHLHRSSNLSFLDCLTLRDGTNLHCTICQNSEYLIYIAAEA
jgi:hypothetical protein